MGWFGGGKKKEEEVKKVGTVEQKKGVVALDDKNGGGIDNPVSAGELKGESVVEILRPEPTGPLPTDVSVFEFGSAGAAGDEKLTLAGYCPVSDEMEPCRWEVFPAGQAEAPGFRILF